MKFTEKSIKKAFAPTKRCYAAAQIEAVHDAEYIFRKAIKKLEPEYSSEWGNLEYQIAALVLSEIAFQIGVGSSADDIAQVMGVLDITPEKLQASCEAFDFDRLDNAMRSFKHKNLELQKKILKHSKRKSREVCPA